MQALRDQDFYKSPGVAETIDWATALTELDARSLTPQMVGDTLGALLKYQDDIARMQGDTLQKVLKEATSDFGERKGDGFRHDQPDASRRDWRACAPRRLPAPRRCRQWPPARPR